MRSAQRTGALSDFHRPWDTGKMPLTIAAARQLRETNRLFTDGVFFVALAPVVDQAASAIGLSYTRSPFVDHVR
jgi:hypothetical protein